MELEEEQRNALFSNMVLSPRSASTDISPKSLQCCQEKHVFYLTTPLTVEMHQSNYQKLLNCALYPNYPTYPNSTLTPYSTLKNTGT